MAVVVERTVMRQTFAPIVYHPFAGARIHCVSDRSWLNSSRSIPMPEKCKNIFLAPTCQSATHNSQSHTHHLGALTAFAAPPPIPIVRGIEINHPLLTPWEWRDADTMLDHLDALEIWNDPTWPDNAWANPGAVDYWTRLLNAGYRITALDGAVLAEERDAAGRAQVQWRNQIDPDEPAWFRCGALDADDRFLAVSNPIFTGPRQTPCPALLANSCLTPDAMAQLTINDTTIDADLVIFDKDGTLIDFEFY